MKRNVLIISNSHGSALIQSVKKGLVTPDCPVHYLIQGANHLLPNLAYKEKKLWPNSTPTLKAMQRVTSESEFLDLTAYSHIVVYGCQLLCMGSGVNWIMKLKQSAQPFSKAARTAAYQDSIRHTSHYTFLAGITDRDIREKMLSVPSPVPNESHPSFKSAKTIVWEHPHRYLNMVKEEITALGVRYMPIPASILLPSKGAVKKAFKTERENDFSHLNPAGGAAVLEAILTELKQF